MDVEITGKNINNNNNNNNVDVYVRFFQNVNNNYNFLRVILFDLLNVYVSVYNYYIQYRNFKLYIKKEFNILFDIAENSKNIYTVDKKIKKINKDLNLPKNTYLVIGLKNYHKYKCIKYIIKEVLRYDQKILNYLIYLQKHIITLINGMNKFNQFLRYCLKILFNYNSNNNYDNTNSILLNNFNKLKENYFLNISKHLN